MYTDTNFKTKKALKEAVKAFNEGTGPAVTYFQPGPWAGNEPSDGSIVIEGPQYPEPHRWYASCKVKDWRIVSVK